MSDDERNSDEDSFDVNKYIGFDGDLFDQQQPQRTGFSDEEYEEEDEYDNSSKKVGGSEDYLPPKPENLNDHYLHIFSSAKFLVDYMKAFDQNCSGEVVFVLRELTTTINEYLELQKIRNSNSQQQQQRQENTGFEEEYLYDPPVDETGYGIPQVVPPPFDDDEDFPVFTIPNEEAKKFEKHNSSHNHPNHQNNNYNGKETLEMKFEKMGRFKSSSSNNKPPPPFSFQIRQFNKKKRTKLCHCYLDTMKKNNYVLNYERQFRICCFLSDDNVASEIENYLSAGGVNMVLENDVEEKKVLSVTKKIQRSPLTGHVSHYLESLHKIGRGEGGNFRISIRAAGDVIVTSERFYVTGLCDAQFRKKVVEYERNGFTKMCYDWELKKK